MKKSILIAGILIIAVGLIVLGLRFLSSDEDTWLCQNGEWVKHGNPSNQAPIEGCAKIIGSFDECAAAGYPIMESYPRRCAVPNGGNFVETPAESIVIKAYFNNSKLDPEVSCNKVFPVSRTIINTPAVARAALEELLKGPTEKEKANGFFTSINSGVEIEKLTIDPPTGGGVAKVEFDEQLEFQVGGSCKVSAVRAQITETLKQFSTVKDVIISINGRTEDILQP